MVNRAPETNREAERVLREIAECADRLRSRLALIHERIASEAAVQRNRAAQLDQYVSGVSMRVAILERRARRSVRRRGGSMTLIMRAAERFAR